jgi:hypothetical protein
MGWRDAPLADAAPVAGAAAASTPAWASAPVVERRGATVAPKKEATPLLERIGTGLMDPIVGAAQIMEKTGIPGTLRTALGIESDMEDVVRQRDAEYVAPEGVDVARIAGNVVNPINWLGGGTGVARAVGTGVIQGALNPTKADQDPGDFIKEKFQQAALGGAGGAVGSVLTKTLGRIAKPIGDKAPETEALEALGVSPTFGQGMAAKGHVLGKALNIAEEGAGSVPFASAPLRARREGGLEQWRAAARQAAAPEGTTMPTGTMDEVRLAWNKGYGDQLAGVPLPYSSVTYRPDMRKLTGGLGLGQDDIRTVKQTFEDLRLNALQNPVPGVQPGAQAAQMVESDLKGIAAGYKSSSEYSQRQIGEAYERLAREYGDSWRNALPANTRSEIAKLDARYPGYVAARQAAKTVGAAASGGDPSRFTPSGLWRASRTADRSFAKRRHVAGEAPLQDLATLGMSLEGRLPDSGTATRAMVGTLIGGGSLLGGLTPAAAAGGGLLALYGTRQFQDYLMGRMGPQLQQQALEIARRMSTPAGVAGSATAIQSGE